LCKGRNAQVAVAQLLLLLRSAANVPCCFQTRTGWLFPSFSHRTPRKLGGFAAESDQLCSAIKAAAAAAAAAAGEAT
jgi:hypothetical protein